MNNERYNNENRLFGIVSWKAINNLRATTKNELVLSFVTGGQTISINSLKFIVT